MKVLVTGASGFIGSALVPALASDGHEVMRLVRREPAPGREDELRWDPAAGVLDEGALEGVDAVVHLSGEAVAGRWTEAKKSRILESRVQGTSFLCERIAARGERPRAFVCASAIGYYGDRGDEELTERSSPGTGFLPDVVRAWEAAAAPAREAGVRVANLRTGIVLSSAGGALKTMLLPFRLGLGGKVGSGRQYLSWVALDDTIGAYRRALEDEGLEGPVNVTAPNPVTNAEFTSTLGRVLGRPTLMTVPAFAARVAIGELAQELLGGARVLPARLLEAAYRFRFTRVEDALTHALGRPA